MDRARSDWAGWGRPICFRFVHPSLHLSRPHHIPDGSLRLAPNSLRDTRDWKETLCAGLQGQYRRPEKPPLEGPIASGPLPYHHLPYREVSRQLFSGCRFVFHPCAYSRVWLKICLVQSVSHRYPFAILSMWLSFKKFENKELTKITMFGNQTCQSRVWSFLHHPQRPVNPSLPLPTLELITVATALCKIKRK